jgi:hypothetical protein
MVIAILYQYKGKLMCYVPVSINSNTSMCGKHREYSISFQDGLFINITVGLSRNLRAVVPAAIRPQLPKQKMTTIALDDSLGHHKLILFYNHIVSNKKRQGKSRIVNMCSKTATRTI